jgi:hypothetical protein
VGRSGIGSPFRRYLTRQPNWGTPAAFAVPRRWHHWTVLTAPAGLVDGQKHPRRLQVSGGGPWFLADSGHLERVGSGDLSLADLKAIEAELGERVFVGVPRQRSLYEYMTGKAPRKGDHRASVGMGPTQRLRRFEELRDNSPPTVVGLARAAQVAVLPGVGPVFVDSYRLFRPGELASLPWTDPRVELPVVRPSALRSALRTVVGRRHPWRRAT